MGTPTTSEPEMKPIDATVGGLVWVRRRNGSWWPGRIVGADELPDDCLVSPKSGAPVKLLGRVDASVDWYNLDKSKRVKAFRCGDYDDWIEKAKASSTSSSKKAVKYARKEDAILQALELEGTLQLKDSPKKCSKVDISSGEQHSVKESEMSDFTKESGLMGEESGCVEDNSKSTQGLPQLGISSEEPNHESAMAKQLLPGTRRRTPNDSEDDGTEGVKRMKGLEDLGMGVVSSLKRKRSQVAHVQEFLKRKHRRRPMTKVLESTAMVPVPVIGEGTSSPSSLPLAGVSDSLISGLQSKDSMGSFSVILNNSDSMGVSSGNGVSQNASEYAFDATLNNIRKEIKISSMSVLAESDSSKKLFDVPFLREEDKPAGVPPVETVSLDNKVHVDCVSTSLAAAADIGCMNTRMEQVSSKWQSKGKRNIRHKNRTKQRDLSKCLDVGKDDAPDISLPRPHPSVDVGFGLEVDNDSEAVKTSLTDGFQGQNDDTSQKVSRRLQPCRQSRFVLNPKYESLEYPIKKFDSGSGLFDVYLEVNAGSRPQHVPYISLMSKLHGRPITGHPLTVEVLENGFCERMLSNSGSHRTGYSRDLHEDPKKTNYASEDAGAQNEVKPDLMSSRPPKKRWASTSCASPGKSSKNRKNGKIRKLSSLTGSHKRREDKKRPLLSELNGPAIPCIPLKVVFIRCLGALNRLKRSEY